MVERVNAVLLGPNGMGKTMVLRNLAHQATLRGHTVRFTTASNMLADLAAQESSVALSRRLRRYCQPRLLCVDEVGYLSYSNRYADPLFEVVTRRLPQEPGYVVRCASTMKAADVLSRLEIAREIYSLVPGDARYLTVRHQQVRAVNLVAALAEKLGSDFAKKKLCIVGGGVAGMTAAFSALRLGVGSARRPSPSAERPAPRDRILVLERLAFPMWNLRHGRTRWLHPYRFLWPEPISRREHTWLPVGNWRGGYAHDVHQQLLQSLPAEHVVTGVREVLMRPVEGGVRISYERYAHGDATRETGESTCDLVIVAIGPGRERKEDHAVNTSYWLDDNVHREDPYRGIASYVVVGNGDGALTDLLRIRLDRSHRQVVEMIDGLVDDSTPLPPVSDGGPAATTWNELYAREVAWIESRKGADGKEEPVAVTWKRYLDLAKKGGPASGHIAEHGRKLTRARIVASNGAFEPKSFAINRFWLAQLVTHDSGTALVPGRSVAGSTHRQEDEVRFALDAGGFEKAHHLVNRVGFKPANVDELFDGALRGKLRRPSAVDLDAVQNPRWAKAPKPWIEATYDLPALDPERRAGGRGEQAFIVAGVASGVLPERARRSYYRMVVSADVKTARSAIRRDTWLGFAFDAPAAELACWMRREGRLFVARRKVERDAAVLVVCTGRRHGAPLTSRRFAVLTDLPDPSEPRAQSLRRALWAGATAAFVFSAMYQHDAERIHELWQRKPVPMFSIVLVPPEGVPIRLDDPREDGNAGEITFVPVTSADT